MANRTWQGRDGRDMDERDLEERSNYYGQGGWRGDDRWRDPHRGDERYFSRDTDRDEANRAERRAPGDERWPHLHDRSDERWHGGPRQRFAARDERWRRDMGRDFSRHEWSPYDRSRDDEDRYGGGFGFGGTDRGFGGGGYGGYGGGYGERGSMGRGFSGMDYGYRDRSMSQREGGFYGPGSGMLDRRGRAPRGYQRSDERIKEDVCDRLMHSWIDAEDVEVEVKQGEVTLSGTVDDRQSKRAIEDIAEEVLGVKDVQNRIRVGRHQHEAQSTTAPSTTGTRKPTA